MPTNLWTAFVTPIVVALLTTLVVEYFAKPRLDARKERLIRDRRQLDELVYGFQKIGLVYGSLPSPRQRIRAAFTDEALMKSLLDAEMSIQTTLDAMSRLSMRYAIAHTEHISRTSLFLGYLLGMTRSTDATAPDDVENLKKVASQLEHFDTYFRVYVGLEDSQEALIKRVFWRMSTAKEYREDAIATLDRLGLKAGDETRDLDS